MRWLRSFGVDPFYDSGFMALGRETCSTDMSTPNISNDVISDHGAKYSIIEGVE
jgi:hypothetical protein